MDFFGQLEPISVVNDIIFTRFPEVWSLKSSHPHICCKKNV